MPPQSSQVCTFYPPTPASTRKKFSRLSSSSLPGLVRSKNGAPSAPRQLLRPLRDAYRAVVASTSRLRPSRSLRAVMTKATYFHLLLLPLFLLLMIELAPPPPPHFTLRAVHTAASATSPSAPAGITSPVNASSTAAASVRDQLFPPHTRPGISIVACCMNRHQTLRTVLPAWLRVANISEVVLVDWSSDPPLRPVVDAIVGTDPRVRVVRVNDEPAWILTRAYNLAVASASHDLVIRTDCDYALAEGFVSAHNLPQHSFYAGNYAHARNENEVHLNGAVYIRRSDFVRVGGYDERIQTYGWDDEELYTRLERNGMSKLNLSYNHVRHVPHGDSARAQADVKFVQVEIDLNSLLLKNLATWNMSSVIRDQWKVEENSGRRFAKVHAVHRPPALKDIVSAPDYDAAWNLALGQRLANDYHVAWDIMGTMTVPMKRLLLTRLNKRMEHRDADKPARVMYVHCMHGLGNRLRALASAMAYANATDREPVVIWEKDAHIAATFDDLFEDKVVLLPSFKPKWPYKGYEKYDKLWLHMEIYNYMEMEGHGAKKGEVIRDTPDKHVYFKSAYVMEVPRPELSSWEADNVMLKSLTPVEEVRHLVQHQMDAGVKGVVGVHIRDRTLERDIKDVNFGTEYGKEASDEMEYWRKKSSRNNFITEMRSLVAGNSTVRFYVATDTAGLLPELRRQFPGKILSTERDCDGRDGQCVRYALVDLLCLSRTYKLYGSNWSSFTEVANRFGAPKPSLAGRDFAVGSDENTTSGQAVATVGTVIKTTAAAK